MTDGDCQRKRFSWFELILMALGGVVLLLIIAPLLGLFLESSPAQWIQTAGESEVRSSIWLTLWISMVGTLLFSLAGIPLAYLLARRDFPFKRLVTGIIDLPVVIPHSAAGIALLGVIARNSVVGRAVAMFGKRVMGESGWTLVGTPVAIMLAMAFVSVPFLINAARDGFLTVPRRLEMTAMNLGASRARTFFTISLPMAWRPILSGMILMWARGLSEFGAVIVVAYYPMTTPVLIYKRFTAFGLKYARPVAAVFIVVCLAVFILLRLLAGRKHYAQD